MNIKRLTDKQVSDQFHTSERNLQQTYKNPKPTKQKKVLSEKEIAEKREQYEVLRLGSTCKAYKISEEQLLKAIDFIKSVKSPKEDHIHLEEK
ncbi:MAG TPA: hypothetical protein ENK75_00150 [Saprospiraceae bacterium]|nr:hypothetical protein [Saprospiraceae bacterium]